MTAPLFAIKGIIFDDHIGYFVLRLFYNQATKWDKRYL